MRLLFFTILSLAIATPIAAADRSPNFVVIFVDDLGYADLGCFGSPDIRTPTLDALASEGMKFTHFYAQHICGPSRAALMTGCHPLRLAEMGNVKEIHPVLHTQEITIAEILKTKGYATGCFGKWDLARHSQTKFEPSLMPNHQGFDTFFGTPTSNDRSVDLYRNEKLIEENADMSLLTERYTNEVIQFIDDNQEKPFFAYVPYTMVHTRLDASPDFKGKSPRGLYGDAVEEIDFSVGRIIDTLKKHSLVENTYFLFTSDNGPWLSKNKNHQDGHLPTDHGGSAGELRSGKVSTWEGGVRVPTILWAPDRVPAGTVCDKIAATIDVLPTFAKLAGTEAPMDRVIDGQDIRSLFKGDFEEADKERVFHYYFINTLQAVRQGKWKLHLPRPAIPGWLGSFAGNRHIAHADWIAFDEPFLVDLEADPSETKSVASEFPEVVAHLLELAEDARADIGDYNRTGENARFFDLMKSRPEKPPFPSLNRRKVKPKKAGRAENLPAEFRVWATSCAHVPADIKRNRESLAKVIRQSEGNEKGAPAFKWDIMIDAGDLSASQTPPIDADGKELIRQYHALTKHRREQIYNVPGNHDAPYYDHGRGSWFQKWGDPLGEYTQLSGVDSKRRPFPVEGNWERYRFVAGNVLFLMLADRNDAPSPVGRGHSRDKGFGGFPAGAVTRATFDWWKRQVLDNQDKLIVTMHHHVLRDTTTGSGFGEGNPRYHGASGGPEGSSYLYYLIENDDPDNFKYTSDAHVFEDFLEGFHQKNGRGAIDFWIGGHTHVKGPDDDFGGKTISESRWGVAFLQAAALTQHHSGSHPLSRLVTFTDGSNRAKVQTYLHEARYKKNPIGFYAPAEITFPLRRTFRAPPPIVKMSPFPKSSEK